MTLTLHKIQVHYSGVKQWWAYSSRMFAIALAETGRETCERIVLSLVFIMLQQHGNKSSKVHFKQR